MSYDSEVFVQQEASPAELAGIVHGVKGLSVENQDEKSLTVVRGAKRRYCFTVDGPFSLDAEDVAEEVTAAVLSPSRLYMVVVEGSTETEIPYAVRFARKVAVEMGGAVLDQQADGVWSRGTSRVASRPAREEQVRIVELRWYALRKRLPATFAASYLAICRRYLPEALPRRFGSYEPLQGKLAIDGDAGFISGWESEDMSFHFSGSRPCEGGSLGGLADPEHGRRGPFWSMSLTFLAGPLKDPRWRDALRRLFIELADELEAPYASAEVLDGALWTGRTLAYTGDSQMPALPVGADGWLGLPPYPLWWAYYGEECRGVSADEFVFSNQATRRGTFHSRSDAPLSRNELISPLKTGLFRRRIAPWVDKDLTSEFAPNERGYVSPPLRKAVCVPAELADPR